VQTEFIIGPSLAVTLQVTHRYDKLTLHESVM